jgi:hypothetical protein
MEILEVHIALFSSWNGAGWMARRSLPLEGTPSTQPQ